MPLEAAHLGAATASNFIFLTHSFVFYYPRLSPLTGIERELVERVSAFGIISLVANVFEHLKDLMEKKAAHFFFTF